MNIQELKRKITKIIDEQKMPNEVKQKIEELYGEYEDVCCNCKYLLTTIMNRDNQEEIEEIQQYIDKDIEENRDSINSVNEQEYEIKKEKLLERMDRELDKLEEKKEENNRTLQPILFDSDEEEKNYREGKVNIEDRQADRINIEAYVIEVMNNMIAEMKSSTKYITTKINNASIDERNEQQIILKNRTAKKFEEDVEHVIMKIKKEVPELGKTLEMQNSEIYKYVEETIEEYKKENPREKTTEEQASDFKNSLKVKVNEEEAIKRAQENNNNQRTLDENIIS